MRKVLVVAFLLLLASQAAATTISAEQMTIDLQDSTVRGTVEVEELTSSAFTLFLSTEVNNFEATIDGEPADCQVFDGETESRIECDVSQRDNFTISFNYTTADLIEREQNRRIFSFSQNFIRPTDSYTLRVILPEGTGILDGKNTSEPVIRPPTNDIGSNGRRITVKWADDPTIGETLSYSIVYEDLSSQDNYIEILSAVLVVLILGITGFLGYNYFMRENVEDVYEELTDDQVQVVEILRDNEGEMLQKDVVDQLDYSKAKISGIVSELVEQEILTKEKEGRSNKLAISKKYRT